MPTRLVHLVVDDPAGLARFLSGALEWPVTFEESDEVVIEPLDDDPAQAGQLPLVFVPVPESKTSKNRVHLDVASTSDEHKAALVARLEGLGARQIDIVNPTTCRSTASPTSTGLPIGGRNRVERSVAAQAVRRVATRYDKRARNYLAWVTLPRRHLAMTHCRHALA